MRVGLGKDLVDGGIQRFIFALLRDGDESLTKVSIS